jgi:hypothetical protein
VLGAVRGARVVVEEVEQLRGVHGLEALIVLVDHAVGDVELELLQTHNLLLQGAARDQTIHIHRLLLTDAVSAVHGLQIFHGVPVVLHEDHRVRCLQIEAQSSHSGGEQHAIDRDVVVEACHQLCALIGGHGAVESHVGDGGHVRLEEVLFDNIEHGLHLTEDEHAMLTHHGLDELVLVLRALARHSDAALVQQFPTLAVSTQLHTVSSRTYLSASSLGAC